MNFKKFNKTNKKMKLKSYKIKFLPILLTKLLI